MPFLIFLAFVKAGIKEGLSEFFKRQENVIDLLNTPFHIRFKIEKLKYQNGAKTNNYLKEMSQCVYSCMVTVN